MSFRISLVQRNNFYVSLLNNDEQAAYFQCVQGLSQGNLTITINSGIPVTSLSKVVQAVEYGCPELFFVNKQYRVMSAGGTITVIFDSKYPHGRIPRMWSELENKINEAAGFADEKSDPYQKILAVNEFLCKEITYSGTREKPNGDAWGALVNGVARCEGISKAAQLILERLGFEVFQAIGELRTDESAEEHSWNIVKYDGEYYNFDFTLNIGNSRYSIPCTEFMFLADTDAHANRTPRMNYPKCINETNSSWARNGNFASCSADFANVKIEQYRTHFYATVKLDMDLTADELNERIPYWLKNELSGFSFGRRCGHRYINFLKVLTFYMLNEIE